MLQEFIPGGIDQDWFFHGYCDAASTCRPAFTGVKERSYPAHAGLTSLGRCEPNAVLSDQVTALLGKLGYRGILDLDLRLDRRDGEYKLLDFNPRLGAQFRLFQTTAGVDVATAAYLDLTGAAIPEGAAGRRAAVRGRELRPAGRARLLAARRAEPARLGGVAARDRRGRLVRRRRPGAVRPDVPADGLAPDIPPDQQIHDQQKQDEGG